MDAFMRRFSINCHSSIRCGGEIVMWFDPFRVEGSPQASDMSVDHGVRRQNKFWR